MDNDKVHILFSANSHEGSIKIEGVTPAHAVASEWLRRQREGGNSYSTYKVGTFYVAGSADAVEPLLERKRREELIERETRRIEQLDPDVRRPVMARFSGF